MTRQFSHTKAATSLLVVCSVVLFAGCGPRPIGRTLPKSIRHIYVPIFETRAYEPGLEEILTQDTIDEFLIDGRVKPVRPERADVILVGNLYEVTITTDDFAEDDFALLNNIEARARITAYGPDDPERREPIYIWNDISAEFAYVADKRFVIDVLQVDVQRDLMALLAREIVNTVMEGEPDYIYGIDEETAEALIDPEPRFKTYESLRDRRERTRGQPPLRTSF